MADGGCWIRFTATALNNLGYPFEGASAQANGSGQITASYTVTWDGTGNYTAYPAPPGFSFRVHSTAVAEVYHEGVGEAEAWAGPVGNRALAHADDDDGYVDDFVDTIYGTSANGGDSPVCPSLVLHAYAAATAAPMVVGLSAHGTSYGQEFCVECEESHTHVLDGYPGE
jgi:hypothetical protein